MKSTRPLLWVVAMLFAVGICVVGIPQSAAAQNRNAESEDDEVTTADRASIKISPRKAKRNALRRVPGRIVGWEVEKEDGRVQYEFKIVGTNGKRYEVEIDAITGEVIEAELEPAAKVVTAPSAPWESGAS